MLCLKKVYRDELLQLALILSLLRVDPDSYLGYDIPAVEVGINDLNDGTSWAHAHAESLINRRLYLHPKSLNSLLLNYEHQVFEDLNALGRYNRISTNRDVTAYLLNVDNTNSSDNLSIANSTSSNLENNNRQPEPSYQDYAVPSSSLGLGPSSSQHTADDTIAQAADLTQEVFCICSSFVVGIVFWYY